MLRQNSRFIDASHPLSFYKGEGRVRVAVYRQMVRTPHLSPLPLIKGRGGFSC